MTEKAVQFDWEKITGPLGETEDIFKDEIERIEKLCKEYGFEKNSSNVISIVGNRGCGKTSLIKAVQKHFKPKEDKAKNISDKEEARYKNFYVTDTIDPSIFDDTLLIPEFFISVLAQEVKNAKENSNGEFAEFYKKLNEIMEVISHIKSNKERFYEDNHPSDIVRTIQKRYRFDELLKELIKSFYTAIGKDENTKMIVCIDDLDLVSNKYVYRMIEDIQKWLNKNCIVILSFREVQLLNIIQDQFIKQNMNLIDKEIISISEIRDQTIQFYEKQMPVSRRIYLKGQTEFFNETARDILKPFVKNMGEIDKSENDNKKDVECTDNEFIWKCLKNEEINFHDFMEKMVRRKVALPLDPVDEKERVHLIYPNGLREMLAFVRMLVEMPKMRDEDGNVLKENLQQNLKNYQNYVLSRAKANLDYKYYYVLDEWIKTSVENKNHYICSKIDELLKNSLKDKKSIDYHQEEVLYVDDEEDGDEDDNDESGAADQGKTTSVTDSKSYEEKNKSDTKIEESNNGTQKIYNKNKLIYVENTASYNVMLGDVIQFIEEIKCVISYDEEIMYMSYLIKLLYSIEILYSFVDECEEIKEDKAPIKLGRINFNDAEKKYERLINCKFLPDDFDYTSRDENLISHIDAAVDDDSELICLVKDVSYSKIRRYSDIWFVARPKELNVKSQYKYRPIFNSEMSSDDLRRNNEKKLSSNFRTDPLSYVLKRSYFEKNDREGYVFYSLFDIDVVLRMIFANKRRDKKAAYVYRKINWIFGDENNEKPKRNPHDIKLKEKISYLFKKRKCIFDDKMIERICELEKDFAKKINFDKYIKNFDMKKARSFVEDIVKYGVLSIDDLISLNKIKSDILHKSRRKLYDSEVKTISDICRKYPKLQDLIK